MTVERSGFQSGARRHAVVIGAGAVGSATAIEALRAGLRVTVVPPGEPAAPQATSSGHAR
ncbi:FAD-dependent oxidoreductase [Variovorax sp.]|uniref:FAD-dependent oxidoreductase n=1 Tax=Variovorax sp. TaxID=1871043 RepID=UPI0034576045